MKQRLEDRAREWRVAVDETFETATSLIAYGRRDDDPVVLKLVKVRGDEWRSGEVLNAFGGRGMVRVLDFAPGAMLLERLLPGCCLVDLSVNDRDDEATTVLAEVIGAMSPDAAMSAFPTVRDWGLGFERYAASGQRLLPPEIVSHAEQVYGRLQDTQTRPRLLHGDLQHSNVLFDGERGWVAIDPKGVVGELEFEIGAALRNPIERPDLFAAPAIIERRLSRFAIRLGLDADRALSWAFAQAVLSAIWDLEDGSAGHETPPSLRLAEAIRSMLM
ncbi:MAG TPA: aminoglycoside phosphotransferase family protein [Thermoanaerobaculia bacterium]|jgi:streptomycin 6-kinase|nr:aminoglycoside phosphotransferase family protein [Thermoanaerobaculia bacterium]